MRCTGLAGVTISASVRSIGEWAFDGCSSLTGIVVAAESAVYSSTNGVVFNKEQTTLVQFPSGRGGSYVVPGHVATIGQGAFSGCGSVTNITIPSSVTNIQNSAFSWCSSLASVTLPNGLGSIEDWTFGGCEKLSSIVIPESVTNIGFAAFQYCRLVDVTIPDSVTWISAVAFRSCPELRRVTIGDGVSTITGMSFAFCPNLASVVIGSNVTNIESWAFWACANLMDVYFLGNAPTPEADGFPGCDNATVYYMPGTSGWTPSFDELPTVLWNPHVSAGDASLGVRTNRFGFTIFGSSNLVIVVEACTSMISSGWFPLQTNTLTGGLSYFSEPLWTNGTSRFYRFRPRYP